MMTILFPGQGVQFTGMGKNLFTSFPKEVKNASDILGYDIVKLCLENTEGKLNLTQYTQPAIYVVNALNYFKSGLGTIPDYFIGHSLGELNALLAAEVFDFETGLKLVQKRGELMGKASGGSMMAVLNMKSLFIKNVFNDYYINDIDLANFNTPLQTVISGPTESIRKAGKLLEEKGANCIPLNVSAPFHSRYMREAEELFFDYVKEINFKGPKRPIIANVTARPYEIDNIKVTLAKQITSSVLWVESIRYLMGKGVMEFKEIGERLILTRMVKEIQEMKEPLTL